MKIHTEMCVAFMFRQNTTSPGKAKCGVIFYFLLDNITNIMLNKVMFIIIDMYNKIIAIIINITSNLSSKPRN